MTLRLILALAVLALPLGGCDPAKDPDRKAAIQEMERRHAEGEKYKGGM